MEFEMTMPADTAEVTKVVTLASVAKEFEAIEDRAGGYWFADLATAAKAAAQFGATVDVPEELAARKARLLACEDGKLLVTVEKLRKEKHAPKRYVKKSHGFEAVIAANIPCESLGEKYDAEIRHCLEIDGNGGPWYLRYQDVESGKESWGRQNLSHIECVLASYGMKSEEIRAASGWFVVNPWRLVNMPFAVEYPGERRWNRDGAKLSCEPQEGEHPHFDMILAHMGENLTPYVAAHPWCQQHGIRTGGDYLLHWVGNMFQRPEQSVPYLVFYSEEQNTGKSTFHLAIKLLMSKGVARADEALTNDRGFNGELAGCLLAVVEEINVGRKGGKVYDRLKDWVTSPDISIHVKGLTPYMQKNLTHWIQNSNNPKAVPVFEGDTRVTMTRVNKLTKEIPQAEMLERLAAEAPAILFTLRKLTLPPPPGRLSLPALETHEKSDLIAERRGEGKAQLETAILSIAAQDIGLQFIADLAPRIVECGGPPSFLPVGPESDSERRGRLKAVGKALATLDCGKIGIRAEKKPNCGREKLTMWGFSLAK